MASGSAEREPTVSWTDSLNLKWLLRLISSSVGQKLVIGTTGLLLCGFLVGHLVGNFLLFVGQKEFDEYASWIHHQKLLPLIEVALLTLFVLHIYLAVVTSRRNAAARQFANVQRESKQTDRVLISPASNWMLTTGLIVLGFLILHLVDLRLGLRPGIERESETPTFNTVVAVLGNPISRTVYTIGSIVLGFHLSHGFASAFMSLGLAHPKYTPAIRVGGILFSIFIAVGFASLPLFVPALQPSKPSATSTGQSDGNNLAPPLSAAPEHG